MSRQEWLLKSEAVLGFITGLEELRQVARVHCYVSMEAEREVSTTTLLEWLCSERKEVYMPYIDRERMSSVRYLPGHSFSFPKSGPPVPEPLILSEEERFDAVIVPVVGVDCRGARIGFGKGWYDRFFERLDASGIRPVRIGLAFCFQVLREVPYDPWDQFLDMVITENGIVNCMDGRA
jgi:5-formyltetrahydrofolate cyclo-ligase